MSHLAELGWVCVAINYRLSPRSTWPDHIVDVKRALAWTKEHIAEYGGDPDWVAITGGSAGGHLSSLAALTANIPDFSPASKTPTPVWAAVPFYGLYDFNGEGQRDPPADGADVGASTCSNGTRAEIADAFRVASPISICNLPMRHRFSCCTGPNDSLIPVEQARAFTTRLREVSRQPVAYAELPFAQHAFDIFGRRGPPMRQWPSSSSSPRST